MSYQEVTKVVFLAVCCIHKDSRGHVFAGSLFLLEICPKQN